VKKQCHAICVEFQSGENTLCSQIGIKTKRKVSLVCKNFLVDRIEFLSSITRGGEDGNGLKVGNIGQRF